MRVSNADIFSSWDFKIIPRKKVTNELVQINFPSIINVKMIMTKTNDFFLHDLRALASLQSVQKHRRGSVSLR